MTRRRGLSLLIESIRARCLLEQQIEDLKKGKPESISGRATLKRIHIHTGHLARAA